MNEPPVSPLSADEAITVRLLASVLPPVGLRAVVQQVLPHCDYLHVHLQNPDIELNDRWLQDPRVSLFTREPYAASTIADGYCIQVCDTHSYPSEYIATMVQAIERWNRKAIVGLGGILMLHPDSEWQLHTRDPLPHDMPVHILYSCALAYHAGVIQVPEFRFEGVDTALWAQRHKLPEIAIKRSKNWVTHRSPLPERLPTTGPAEHRCNWQLFAG